MKKKTAILPPLRGGKNKQSTNKNKIITNIITAQITKLHLDKITFSAIIFYAVLKKRSVKGRYNIEIQLQTPSV